MVTESAAIEERRSRRDGGEELGAEDDDAEQVDDGDGDVESGDVDARFFGAELPAAAAFGLTDDALASKEDLIPVTLRLKLKEKRQDR